MSAPVGRARMTAAELIDILSALPPDQELVIDWYEGGPAMLSTAHRASDGDLDSDATLWIQR